MSHGRNEALKPALWKNKLRRKSGNTECPYVRKLYMKQLKCFCIKHLFLAPFGQMKTFTNQEEFSHLIGNWPERSTTDFKDIWFGNILQQFLMTSKKPPKQHNELGFLAFL